MASPRYSNTCPVPPPIPIRAMSARMMSFALTPAVEPPVDPDLVRLRLALEERLGGEDHLDLARPDPERERPERAVRRRVAVAAHDRHARLRQPELRPDDVDDALGVAAERVERDAEVAAVRLELGDLGRRLHVDDRQAARRRRGAVVGGRDGLVGAPDREAAGPEARERLRAGDLVDEVQVDREDGRRALVLRDDMVVPDLLDECSRVAHAGGALLRLRRIAKGISAARRVAPRASFTRRPGAARAGGRRCGPSTATRRATMRRRRAMRTRRPDWPDRHRGGVDGHPPQPRGWRGSSERGGAARSAAPPDPLRGDCQASADGRAAAFSACQRMSCSRRRSMLSSSVATTHVRRRVVRDNVDPAADRPADRDLRRSSTSADGDVDLKTRPSAPGGGRGAPGRCSGRRARGGRLRAPRRSARRSRWTDRRGAISSRDTRDPSIPARRPTARWLRPASSRKRRRSSARSRRMGCGASVRFELELRSRHWAEYSSEPVVRHLCGRRWLGSQAFPREFARTDARRGSGQRACRPDPRPHGRALRLPPMHERRMHCRVWLVIG